MENSNIFLNIFNAIDWPGIAKVVLSIIMFAASGFCLYIVLKFKQIHDRLYAMEIEAQGASDRAIIQFHELRNSLIDVRYRLAEIGKEPETTELNEIVRTALPLAWLAFSRERNIITWFSHSAKLGQKIMQYIRQKL